jgi:peptidoglycan/LPS O-acetylase OafA/YrhL
MRYRREIDGLRAVAVIPVILFHAGLSCLPGGYVGVDVFFVISGYLISNIIMQELDAGRFSIIEFYERRARRILPALFFVLTTCLIPAWFWLLPHDYKSFSQSLVAVCLFASNILFWKTSNYFSGSAEMKPLLHTWSLAVEEQFYIFFPLLLMLLWKLRKQSVTTALAAVGAASLLAASYGSANNPTSAFYLLPTRGWELVIGALLARQLNKGKLTQQPKWVNELTSLGGFLLLSYSILFFDKNTPTPSFLTLIPTVGAALIIYGSTHETLVGRLLGSRPFVSIGLISYSAYLWHQPIFSFARHQSINKPSGFVFALLIFTTFAAAYLTWKFVEAPFRKKDKFSRNYIFTASIIGGALFGTIGLGGHLGGGLPGRFDARLNSLSKENKEKFEQQVGECWRRFDKEPTIASACHLGKSDSKATYLLLGDSHASALSHELDELSRAHEISGLNYTYGSCPPLFDHNPIPFVESDTTCANMKRNFVASLKQGNDVPDTVIISARWALLMERNRFNNNEGGEENGNDWYWDVEADGRSYKESMRLALQKSIRKILESGRRVILIYPSPEMGWDVPMRLAKTYRINGNITPTDASTSHETYQARNEAAISALDEIEDSDRLVRIRPEPLLCPSQGSGRCLAHTNGISLYFDDNHLSNAGAFLLAQKIIQQLTGS